MFYLLSWRLPLWELKEMKTINSTTSHKSGCKLDLFAPRILTIQTNYCGKDNMTLNFFGSLTGHRFESQNSRESTHP